MTHFARIFGSIVLGMSAMTTASAQPVSAGQVFSGPLINIRSPQADGWRMVRSSPAGMVFASKGIRPEDSYVAAVNFFPLESTPSADALVALIKREAEDGMSKQRFEVIENKFEYSDLRAYPCVRMTSVVNDKNAATGLFSRTELKLETRALYCRHPQKQENGFSIVFSHRGETLDAGFDGKAQMFIEGVNVPGDEQPNQPLQPTASDGG